MNSILFLIIAAIFGVGCSQDPFNGQTFVEKNDELATAPSVEPPTPPENYTLDFLPVMSFIEGKEQSYALQAKVPAPGVPILKVSDLPKGAVFNEQEQKIIWTPDFEQANDLKNPNVVARTYPIKIQLATSLRPHSIWERGALLVVSDIARKFEVQTIPRSYLDEGKSFTQELTVLCEDFPDGPFEISADGLPAGAVILPVEGFKNKYRITYEPRLSDVTVLNTNLNSTLYKELDIIFHVRGPRGHLAVTSRWAIRDMRQQPILSLPKDLSQGLDVSFTVIALDPNFETNPSIEIYSSPNYGKLKLEMDSAPTPHSSVARVRWTEIPPSKIGSSVTLTLRACSFNGYKEKYNCTIETTKVLFEPVVHLVPSIDRVHWPKEEKRQYPVGKSEYIDMPILDAENASQKVRIEIQPAEMANEVSWSNGRLVLRPKTVGEKSFLIIATSVYNVSTAELFYFNTVPQDWASTVLVTDSTLAKEVTETSLLFEKTQGLNPTLQTVDKLFMMGRTALVFLTNGLMLPKPAIQNVEAMAPLVKNVAVLSPLIAEMTGNVSSELKGLGFEVIGRYKTITDAPPLSEMTVQPVAGGPLAAPAKPIHLNELLNTESSNPSLFQFGANANCSGLLNLSHPTLGKTYLVAAVCRRATGGKILVTGFEWAALLPDQEDLPLIKTWFGKVFP